MRVLVTGGAGFIGSNIADALVAAGDDVCVLDNLTELGGGRREFIPAAAHFVEGDVCDETAVLETITSFKPDAICHQAAQTSVVRGNRKPAYDASVNVLGTINLLNAAAESGVGRFVFASTAATYGHVETLPIDEETLQRPISPYGISKFASERYIQFFAKDRGLSYGILRYGNVYGPRQNPHGEGGVVAIFTSRFIAKREVQINWDGEQTRDFTFVGDVVRANLLALRSDVSDTFVIGTGKRTSINEIYRDLVTITGFEAPVEKGPHRATDVRESCFQPAKAERVLGWRAETPLQEGLRQTLQFHASRT